MSLGWAGQCDDPEAISGGMVRIRKNHILHLPMIKLEYKSKQEFLDRVMKIANDLWDHMERGR